MKNIWALELSLCGEAGTAGQQQHPQHLRTFQRRFHRRNHRHGQGLSLTVWMQESSSSPSERFGLSSLRGSKCSPWGFSEGQGFDWCRDAAPVEVGIIPGGQAGHGWRFWGVATSLGGISSPWHSIPGWSSLPALPNIPQSSYWIWIAPCSICISGWIADWRESVPCKGEQEINPKVLFIGVTKRMWTCYTKFLCIPAEKIPEQNPHGCGLCDSGNGNTQRHQK